MYLLAEPATKVEILNSSGPDLDGEQVGRESHTWLDSEFRWYADMRTILTPL
jgi:hypothetical protein